MPSPPIGSSSSTEATYGHVHYRRRPHLDRSNASACLPEEAVFRKSSPRPSTNFICRSILFSVFRPIYDVVTINRYSYMIQRNKQAISRKVRHLASMVP